MTTQTETTTTTAHTLTTNLDAGDAPKVKLSNKERRILIDAITNYRLAYAKDRVRNPTNITNALGSDIYNALCLTDSPSEPGAKDTYYLAVSVEEQAYLAAALTMYIRDARDDTRFLSGITEVSSFDELAELAADIRSSLHTGDYSVMDV